MSAALVVRGATAAGAGSAGASGVSAAASGAVEEIALGYAQQQLKDRILSGGSSKTGSGQRTSEILWTVTQGLQLAETLNSQLPSFSHAIDVTVTGGPKSDIQRIWSLCLSTAFGRYRQAGLQGIQGASLEGYWDITQKVVRCRLSYTNSGSVEVAQVVAANAGYGRDNSTSNFLMNGPTQETVGGNRLSWVEAEQVLAQGAVSAGYALIVGGAATTLARSLDPAGILSLAPSSTVQNGVAAGAFIAAALKQQAKNAQDRLDYPIPDAGRLITTATKTNPDIQPPPPSGDGLSRSAPFIALVSNALTDPCYLPASPPQVKRKKRKPKFFPKGLWEKRVPLNTALSGYNQNVPVVTATFGDSGDTTVYPEDGYPKAFPVIIPDLTGVRNPGV